MTLKEKSAVIPAYSFSEVVDDACEKLMDKQIKYSIQRIQQMDELLCDLEKELDDFLHTKNRDFE
jgi:hypothetical protein